MAVKPTHKVSSILFLVFIGCFWVNIHVFDHFRGYSYYKKIAVTQDGWKSGKDEYCVISTKGSDLTVGEKVEIIDEARCLNSQYSVDDDTVSRKFPVGLVKIRLISIGQEGWTWSKSVDFD